MSDKEAVVNQRERYMELAAIFKEKKRGSIKAMKRLLAKFALQEGVNKYKANAAFSLLTDAGLIIFTSGHKSWKYNPDAEWELFQINI